MRLTRRDMLKLGIAVGGATVLPGGRLLADGGGQSGGLGSSPRTTPFVVELLPGRGIPPVAQPVAPFPTLPDPGNCVNVDGSTAFHVHGPRVVLVVAMYPAYRVITSPHATAFVIVATNMATNFIYSIGIGAIYAFLSEAFPKSVRSSGLAILYALGVAIFGGTTQFVVAWLIDWTGNPMVPGWYQMIASVAAIVGVLLMNPHPDAPGGES